MAQHFETKSFSQKYFRNIEKSIRNKFKKGIQNVKNSFIYFEIKDGRAKEYPSDLIFQTYRKANRRKEIFEVHFDEKKKRITKIYFVV